MRRIAWISTLFLLLLLMSPGQLSAQDNVTQWLRYDVTLTLQQNSGLSVEELHEVALVQGATTFQRVIPANKLESISHVQVLALTPGGGQREYQQADTQSDHTFQVVSSGNQYTIQLFFPPANAPSTKFVLRYFVVGGLRVYDEGDQLDWRPFGEKAIAPIANSSVTINLPTAIAQDQLIQSSTGLAVEKSIPDDTQAVFRAANVAAGDKLEISLTIPPGIIQASPPAWQQLADFIPILRWSSVIVAVLLLFIGLAAAFGMWYLRARDLLSASGKVPRHIQSPPSELSPAVAGVLLDGKPKPRHITATLLDLAFRGVINIYCENADGSTANDKEEPVFKLYGVDKEKMSASYETTLYGKIFGYVGGKKRELSAVRRDLYMAVPEMKSQIQAEILKAGYLIKDSQTTRRQYMFVGGASAIMSIILAVLVALLASGYTAAMALPCLSIAIGAAAFVVVGYVLPDKTEVGAKEVVRWQAFRRYLQELDKGGVKKSRVRFARLLPYAVAFGLEKDFIKKFAVMNTPIPKWWSIPEEKLPDITHEKAHAWVSESLMSQPQAQPRPEKARTTSVIRRLGTANGDSESNSLLKHIQPTFVALIDAGQDVFAKAPDIHNEEIDFDSLAD